MMLFALLSVFLIEVSLYFFVSGDITSTYGEQTMLFKGLIDPPNFLISTDADGNITGGFIFVLAVIVGVGAVISMIPGWMGQVNQWTLFALAVAQLLLYSVVTTHFWSFLRLSINSGLDNLVFSGFIASLITAPLILLYITAMFEWTRFNQ